MTDIDKKRRGSFAQFAGATYLSLAFGFVTGPIVARNLGPAGRGECAAVLAYSGVITTVAAFGVGSAVVYASARLQKPAAGLFGAAIKFGMRIIGPCLLMAFVTSEYILADLSNAARIGAFVFVSLTPVSVVMLCLNSLLVGEGALGPLARVRLYPLLASALGVVLFAALDQLTVETYLALTFVTSLVLALVLLVRGVGMRPARGEPIRPLLSYGRRAYLGSLAGFANNQLDQLLIAPVLGAADLGLYAIAVTLAGLPQAVVHAFGARGPSVISQSGDVTDAAEAYLRLGLALSAVVSLPLVAVAPFAIPVLYGAAFAKASTLLVILMLGAFGTSGSILGGAVLDTLNQPQTNSRSELIALVVTGIGLVVLLPLLGVAGAAITSSLAYSVRFALQVAGLQRLAVVAIWPGRAEVGQIVRRALTMGKAAAGRIGPF